VLPNGTLRRPHLRSLEEFARLSPIAVIAPVAEASECQVGAALFDKVRRSEMHHS
jgi:hypothetical protein